VPKVTVMCPSALKKPLPSRVTVWPALPEEGAIASSTGFGPLALASAFAERAAVVALVGACCFGEVVVAAAVELGGAAGAAELRGAAVVPVLAPRPLPVPLLSAELSCGPALERADVLGFGAGADLAAWASPAGALVLRARETPARQAAAKTSKAASTSTATTNRRALPGHRVSSCHHYGTASAHGGGRRRSAPGLRPRSPPMRARSAGLRR